jgi:hypothetical protein
MHKAPEDSVLHVAVFMLSVGYAIVGVLLFMSHPVVFF